MEENNLKVMIERFFNAELTVAEERELCSYLREHDVPTELRKDKEAIMALCACDVEVELPAGAEARLEAMLDTLAQDETLPKVNENGVAKTKRRQFKVPRFVWYGAAAMVLLTMGYTLMSVFDSTPLQHDAPKTGGFQAVAHELPHEYEEDTFDNPEDALECFKGAIGNMMLAVNTTQNNALKIENALAEAVAPYKKIININIQ